MRAQQVRCGCFENQEQILESGADKLMCKDAQPALAPAPALIPYPMMNCSMLLANLVFSPTLFEPDGKTWRIRPFTLVRLPSVGEAPWLVPVYSCPGFQVRCLSFFVLTGEAPSTASDTCALGSPFPSCLIDIPLVNTASTINGLTNVVANIVCFSSTFSLIATTSVVCFCSPDFGVVLLNGRLRVEAVGGGVEAIVYRVSGGGRKEMITSNGRWVGSCL